MKNQASINRKHLNLEGYLSVQLSNLLGKVLTAAKYK